MQVGGNMIETGSGEEAIADESGTEARPRLDIESFAVIHDEPYLTIVYSDGEFRGEIVDATIDKLKAARVVAARYNLAIDQVRCDYHTNFILHLSEKEAPA